MTAIEDTDYPDEDDMPDGKRPLRDLIGEALMRARYGSTPITAWVKQAEETRERHRRDADRLIYVAGELGVKIEGPG